MNDAHEKPRETGDFRAAASICPRTLACRPTGHDPKRYAIQSNSLLDCPSIDETAASPSWIRSTNYSYNWMYFHRNKRINQIGRPDGRMIFHDSEFYHTDRWNYHKNEWNYDGIWWPGPVDVIHQAHNGRANFVFLDNHVNNFPAAVSISWIDPNEP